MYSSPPPIHQDEKDWKGTGESFESLVQLEDEGEAGIERSLEQKNLEINLALLTVREWAHMQKNFQPRLFTYHCEAPSHIRSDFFQHCVRNMAVESLSTCPVLSATPTLNLRPTLV